MYVKAGHKGNSEGVQRERRKGRRRALKGNRGRGRHVGDRKAADFLDNSAFRQSVDTNDGQCSTGVNSSAYFGKRRALYTNLSR